MQIIPQLRDLEHEFERELVVIGVHSPKFTAERRPENLRAAILRHGLTHPVVNDNEYAVWQSYGVRAWPTLMFIDPRGYVYAKHEGEFPLQPVRELLRDMIADYDAEGLIDRTPLPLEPLTDEDRPLRFPGKILADPEEDRLFVADSGHRRVLVVRTDGTVLQTIGAGTRGFTDGSFAEATFAFPLGLALSPDRQTLYIADQENHALRAADLNAGTVRTVAGTGARGRIGPGGPGRQTALASPWDLVFRDGLLWIAMAGMHQLWTYDPATETVRPAAGTGVESIHDGPLAEATFAQPQGITVQDGILYVADSESSAIRRVDPVADRVRRLVGRGLFDFGDIDARGDSVRLQHVQGVAATVEDGAPVVYLADTYNDKIKRLVPETREVTTVLGGDGHGHVDGDAATAEFWEPSGLSIAGRTLYIADTNNHAIRAADLDRGEVRTIEIKEPATGS
ncbi:MAG TPA: alkyl hydroperoxide reductase [Thermomicrobiales bacterium]